MKRLIVLLLLITSINLYSQNGFNLGSTKEEVRTVQGEPNAISADWQGNTVWYFDDYEMARVTFSKNKVIAYKNFQNVLRIAKKRKALSKQEKDFFDFIRDGIKKDTVKILDDVIRESGYDINYNDTGVKHISDASKMFEKYGQNWSAIEGHDYSEHLEDKNTNDSTSVLVILGLIVLVGITLLLLYKKIGT